MRMFAAFLENISKRGGGDEGKRGRGELIRVGFLQISLEVLVFS
jgi:hypothetical protein